jgi:ribonuclease J
MTSLTFYGGAGEIGGNKILLEDQGAKIYLDFGESFGFGEEFFYEYLSPRKANGMEVLFEFNLIPKLPKLYSKSMLQLTDLRYQAPDVDAVFISHSHLDHCGHLDYLDETIPIYMGHGTKHIIDTYHQIYPGFADIGEHSTINLFKTGDRIKVKHLIIEPIHVEHSIPGAYGFIIHTSKGAIVYSGDFRLHGPMRKMTEEFVAKAKKSRPIAMLCEGTRITSESENIAESEVEKTITGIIKSSKGLVMAYWSMTNVDRFKSFYKACVKNKRILVIDTRFAFIIENLSKKVDLPDVRRDKNIRVYFRLEKTCTLCESDYKKWEREYYPNRITYKDIVKSPKRYLMHLGFYRLMELVYLKPKNADFIYSMSEHFLEGDDNEEQRQIWENWMGHFGIGFHKAHCSGHASAADLKQAISEIAPRLLIPIHTQKPEKFNEIYKCVKIVKRGESIRL